MYSCSRCLCKIPASKIPLMSEWKCHAIRSVNIWEFYSSLWSAMYCNSHFRLMLWIKKMNAEGKNALSIVQWSAQTCRSMICTNVMCKLQKQKVKFILMLIAYVIDAAFITLNVVTMQEINSIHLSYLLQPRHVSSCNYARKRSNCWMKHPERWWAVTSEFETPVKLIMSSGMGVLS